jgi:hypothetical protein
VPKNGQSFSKAAAVQIVKIQSVRQAFFRETTDDTENKQDFGLEFKPSCLSENRARSA